MPATVSTYTCCTRVQSCAESNNGVVPLQLYASASYLDDLMLASAWLAEVTGRPAYLTAAETYWDRIFNGASTSWQSQIPDWDNQWWAGNVILLGLTGRQRYQVSAAQHATLPGLMLKEASLNIVLAHEVLVIGCRTHNLLAQVSVQGAYPGCRGEEGQADAGAACSWQRDLIRGRVPAGPGAGLPNSLDRGQRSCRIHAAGPGACRERGAAAQRGQCGSAGDGACAPQLGILQHPSGMLGKEPGSGHAQYNACEPFLQLLCQLHRLPPQAWRSTCGQHLPATIPPESTRQQWVV